MQEIALNLSGKKYGSLTVTKKIGHGRNESTIWKCQCKYCGRATSFSSWDLVSGKAHCQCMSNSTINKCLKEMIEVIPAYMGADSQFIKSRRKTTWANAAYDYSEYYQESRCAL